MPSGCCPTSSATTTCSRCSGWWCFYGLEGLSRPDAGGGAGEGIAAAASFAVFGAYNAVIGYLLVEQVQAGALRVVLFGFAMGLHLLVIDEALREQHRDPHERAVTALLLVV